MKQISENEKSLIKELYEKGENVRNINKKLGISEKLVCNCINEMGINRKNRKTEDELNCLRLKAKELYESGVSVDDISLQFNVNRTTILNYLNFLKVKIFTRKESSFMKNEDYMNQIKELYEQGYNSYEIGEKLNKSYKTILHHLKRMKIERRSNKKIDDDKFKEMWDNGATDDEFMKEFDIARATIRGYRIRHDCHVIQWFSQTEQSLSDEQEQMILGSLLGDMSIRSSSDDSNANLALVHCEAQKELFMKKVEILGEFMGNYKLCIPKPDSRTGKIYTSFRGYSKCHPVFKEIYNLLYPNNKKTITKEYLSKIHHPIALAYWFMDDGTYSGNFATNGFTENGVDLLVDFLKDQFNILSHKRPVKNNQFIIQIEKSSRDYFDKLVFPYFVDSMKYKLKLH